MIKQTCQIPIPPSVNELYKNARKGRVKTAKYEAWCVEAIIRIRQSMKPVKSYPVQVELVVWGGDDRKFNSARDIANCEKASTDALVSAGIIPNDNVTYVWKTSQEFQRLDAPKTACFVVVTEPGLEAAA